LPADAFSQHAFGHRNNDGITPYIAEQERLHCCTQAGTADGVVIEAEHQDAPLDRRTPAQRRHDEILVAREKERTAKMASKSHRDRVREFNEYLGALTEHHDIPKVGPG